MKLLFICTGNTCRSPLAAGYAKTLAGMEADSCGLAAVSGAAATEQAVAVAQEYGFDLSLHRAKPVTAEAVRWADRIFVMSPQHRVLLTQLFPQAQDKISVLHIADPYGGNVDTYRTCMKQIVTALEKELWN